MYICVCHGVTDKHIHSAVTEGAKRFKDLRKDLKVATSCGRCTHCAKNCLDSSLQQHRMQQGITTPIDQIKRWMSTHFA